MLTCVRNHQRKAHGWSLEVSRRWLASALLALAASRRWLASAFLPCSGGEQEAACFCSSCSGGEQEVACFCSSCSGGEQEAACFCSPCSDSEHEVACFCSPLVAWLVLFNVYTIYSCTNFMMSVTLALSGSLLIHRVDIFQRTQSQAEAR